MEEILDISVQMSEYNFATKYAQTTKSGSKETWDDAVDRIWDMHLEKYSKIGSSGLSKLLPFMEFAKAKEKEKAFLSAQRARQFASSNKDEGILKHELKMYNCLSTYVDRPKVFSEIMYALLCGGGVGFSVQKEHIYELPCINKTEGGSLVYIIEDSIEGWADAIDKLVMSYFEGTEEIRFDYSQIRPEGSLIAGQFMAPGPEGLRKSIEKIRDIFEKSLKYDDYLKSIEVYDIVMWIADAVLSGGVRRSATICLFSPGDTDMINAKTGDWYLENGQRRLSNNSVVFNRKTVKQSEFFNIMESVKEFGEPGFIFVPDENVLFNPCFTGDTEVAVADGRNSVDIKSLSIEGKTFQVYSAKKYGKRWKTEIKDAVAFKTGTKKIVKVVLNNGDSFRCTPDHLLAIKDGGYIEAINSKGKNLEPFYSFLDRTKKNNRMINSISDGHKKQSRMIWEYHNGKIDWVKEEDEYIGECVLNNVYVVSVEDAGIEDVYDLTVEDNHNFYINTSVGEFDNYKGVLVHNCSEIGLVPYNTDNFESGFQGCNLSEISGLYCDTKDKLMDAVKAATIAGTLQAGYTDFKYLDNNSKRIFEQEALLGVSITGWMNNPDILFNEEIMKEAAELALKVNEEIAEIIGINKAARITTVKPSGNSSVLLGTTSGIHGEHSEKYIRNIQVNKVEIGGKEMERVNPDAVEQSAYTDTDNVISFPITSKNGSIMKDDLLGVKQLEYVKKAQTIWVLNGMRPELCTIEGVTHNVSNTIQVPEDDWLEVAEFIWENRDIFSGVSLLPTSGELSYPQAPFQKVSEPQYIVDTYGVGSMFSSGLIVGSEGLFDNLWKACDAVLFNEDFTTLEDEPLLDKFDKNKKADWVRRFKKFSVNYFNGDDLKTSECLKEVQLLHKWNKLNKSFKQIKWDSIDFTGQHTKTADNAAIACSGGACEI